MCLFSPQKALSDDVISHAQSLMILWHFTNIQLANMHTIYDGQNDAKIVYQKRNSLSDYHLLALKNAWLACCAGVRSLCYWFIFWRGYSGMYFATFFQRLNKIALHKMSLFISRSFLSFFLCVHTSLHLSACLQIVISSFTLFPNSLLLILLLLLRRFFHNVL